MKKNNHGYVYFIKLKDRDIFKIGITKKHPTERFTALQSGIPLDLRWYIVIWSDDCRKAEKVAHDALSYCRIRGEWFNASGDEIDRVLTNKLGIRQNNTEQPFTCWMFTERHDSVMGRVTEGKG